MREDDRKLSGTPLPASGPPDDLSAALKAAMAVPPPAGLDGRILSRVAARRSEGDWTERLRWLPLRLWGGALAACSVALVALGVVIGAASNNHHEADADEQDVLTVLAQADTGYDGPVDLP